MKNIQKYIYIILCSAVLIVIAICASASAEEATQLPSFLVYSQDQSKTSKISVYDAKDGNFYVFLPAYADMEKVLIELPGNHAVSLGDIKLFDGMACGEFELEKPYAFSIDDREVATLRFYHSSNVATMYINTVSGSMDAIHKDIEYEEYASIALYTVDGDINYSDKLITLEGRGNSSWSRDKKSYTITLRQSSPLLDMGSSIKWILNSNGYDITNLHNKIVYEFADSVAKNPAWSPDCAYTEVYFNGQYAGLYLLCQKIDTGHDHLNLGHDDYYFEQTFSGRIWNRPAAFYISSGRSIDILVPANCDSDQKDYLVDYIAGFQEALYSDTGINEASGLAWSDYIDMDSWARKYLIEEVFSNFDGGQASQFFWLDVSEQKLYAGPCWDYDLTFGQFWGTTWSTPNCLLAQRDWEEDFSWYHALCQKEEFMELVVQIYEAEFRPLLQKYIDEVIDNIASDIEYNVLIDRHRWAALYAKAKWDISAESMVDYLRSRMEFLDSLWLDRANFCTITLWTEEIYNICVPTGSVGTIIPETDVLGASGPWYIFGTNEPFDMTQPITADVTLTTLTPD